jgi:hypothetical protein
MSFLEGTNAPEDELIKRFMDKETARRYMEEASKLGDLTFEALTLIRNGNQFDRLLVV